MKRIASVATIDLGGGSPISLPSTSGDVSVSGSVKFNATARLTTDPVR